MRKRFLEELIVSTFFTKKHSVFYHKKRFFRVRNTRKIYYLVDGIEAPAFLGKTLKKTSAMKDQKSNVERHGKGHADNHRHGKRLYKNDPIPKELLEKPKDARKKQLEDSEMPSDFWL